MAGSIALYSNSSPAIWLSHGVNVTSCFDVDAHCRPQPGKQIGGLSSLFATPHSRFPCGTVCESLDSACLSSCSCEIIRSSPHYDLCTDREGIDIPFSSANRQCSPVSVFQGPSSHGSVSSYKLSACSSCSSSLIDNHLGLPRKRSSLAQEKRHYVARHDGLDTSRSQNWSNFASGALVSYIKCDKPLKLFEDEVSCEDFPSESNSVQLGGAPTDGIELLFPVEDDLTMQKSVMENGKDSNNGIVFPSMVEQVSLSAPVCEHADLCLSSLSEQILRNAVSRHEIFKDPLVLKAFKEAAKAHSGQFRATGDPYLVHCVETALLLALAGASKTVVAAGLLHDTLDDCSWDHKQLREAFGNDIADLVIGVSRLSELSQLARDKDLASRTSEAGRLRMMFLSMVDIRVVLIKLADRLHNMRTLGALSDEKRQRIAHETLEVFAPLANRLGIWSWKAEMEDLCFQHLNPSKHEMLKKALAKGSREVMMMEAIQKLDEALRKEGIFFHDLCGRSKNLFSIYTKMTRKSRRFDEIYDVRGLRLIVSNEDACYAALDVVHWLWPHISENLKDYIKYPKSNGYRSLHTVVVGDDEMPLEIQIRTVEMHHQAEFGMAAHWRYKEGNSEHSSSVVQRIEWARWVLTWQNELVDSKLRLSPLEMDLRPPCPFTIHMDGCPHLSAQCGQPNFENDAVFVIMLEDEKVGVQELPSGSTAADLVTRIYGQVPAAGNVCLPSWEENRLKINHETVTDLDQKIQMGDLIEVLPFYTPEVLDKCRDSIRRMYADDVTGISQTSPVPNLA